MLRLSRYTSPVFTSVVAGEFASIIKGPALALKSWGAGWKSLLIVALLSDIKQCEAMMGKGRSVTDWK